MNKIVVYTAIFNNYDWLKEPVIVPDNVDFICYTDSKKLKSKNWIIKVVDLNGKSPSLLNREIKLLYPLTELKDYDYSLYVDGSIMIKENLLPFFEKYCGQAPIMNFKHPNNDCIFIEMIRCIQQGRGNANKLVEQYAAYQQYGMPKHWGLSDNKIILRENNSLITKTIMEEWYWHVVNYSGRDQVCLSYVYFKNKYSYHFYEENIENNIYFETWPHNIDPWYIRCWRHFKWFCERNHFLVFIIKFLERYIKPLFISKNK